MSSFNKTDVTPQLFLLISTNIELIPSFAFIASPLKATAWEATIVYLVLEELED